MSAQISRIDFARRRKLGLSATLKLFEKTDNGLKVTQTLQQGWHVGRAFSRAKGALVDRLLIDPSSGVDPDKLKRARGVDLVTVTGEAPDEETTIRRYDFDSGKPEPLDLTQIYTCDLRANFGDDTPYDES